MRGSREVSGPLPPVAMLQIRHEAYVRSLVARLGVSPAHEQEDLVQEAMIQAHRSRLSPLEPRALLFGITRHIVFRWIAKRERERGALKAWAEETGDEVAQSSAEQEQQVLERHRVVRSAIGELPTIFREVFVRVALEEAPMAEVAGVLGIPINTGYTRLHIARAKFAEAMSRILARRQLRKDDL